MEAAHQLQSGHIPRVLLADADADERSIYTESLHEAGCDVIEAADGRDALAKALVRPPSLVVSDVLAKIAPQVQKAKELREEARQIRSSRRHATTTPPLQPPVLVCPSCDRPLMYRHSYRGGVGVKHPEQWDYYQCPGQCGTFQYRQRTRTLRVVR
jgi:CheY-like chemotaxis protein